MANSEYLNPRYQAEMLKFFENGILTNGVSNYILHGNQAEGVDFSKAVLIALFPTQNGGHDLAAASLGQNQNVMPYYEDILGMDLPSRLQRYSDTPFSVAAAMVEALQNGSPSMMMVFAETGIGNRFSMLLTLPGISPSLALSSFKARAEQRVRNIPGQN